MECQRIVSYINFIYFLNFCFVVVLNEVERCAKRELIERNRERKELEKVQTHLRRFQIYYNTPQLSNIQTQLINKLTSTYCKEIDVSLQMDADFALQDSFEQFNSLLKEILQRTFNFASSIPFFNKVNVLRN